MKNGKARTGATVPTWKRKPVDGLVGIVAPSDIARLLSLVEIASRPLDPASP